MKVYRRFGKKSQRPLNLRRDFIKANCFPCAGLLYQLTDAHVPDWSQAVPIGNCVAGQYGEEQDLAHDPVSDDYQGLSGQLLGEPLPHGKDAVADGVKRLGSRWGEIG